MPHPNVYFMLPLKFKKSIYSNRTVGTLGLLLVTACSYMTSLAITVHDVQYVVEVRYIKNKHCASLKFMHKN